MSQRGHRRGGASVTAVICNAATKSQAWFLVPATASNEYHIRPGNVGWRNLAATSGGAFLSTTDGGNQRFKFNTFTGGLTDQYQIQNVSGLPQCLTRAISGTGVGLSSCSFAQNGAQQWLIRPRAVNFHFIAKHSGKCMDVQNASLDNNALVQQFNCAEVADHQRWSLQPAGMSGSDRFFFLKSKRSGKCLDVPNASTASGVQLQQFTCNSQDNQRWKLVPDADGRVSIVNKNSQLCIDIPNASQSPEVLQQYSCHGGDNQKWYYTNVVQRHVQMVMVANSAGQDRETVSQTEMNDHYLRRISDVYGPYGIQLLYDENVDKTNANDDCLYNLSSGNPGGWGCAATMANTWPGKVVIFLRHSDNVPGGGSGFSYGYLNFITSLELSPVRNACNGSVVNSRHLAHEFGHYMGLQHTFPADNDLLAETLPDPNFGDCLNPTAPSPPGTALGPDNMTTVTVDNVMSYYYHVTPRIGPNQAAIVRGVSYARFY